jgi:hypothetical protein
MNPTGIILAVAAMTPIVAMGQTSAGAGAPERAALVRTPEAIHEEHVEIHSALERATHEPGQLGAAARALASVLDPHFRREEEIATPPLGLLAPLARGPVTPEMRAVIPMTDALERELPRMLAEHRQIGAARQRFETAARRARKAEYVRLADTLAHHARQEEEVLYPAAILVGHVVKDAGR